MRRNLIYIPILLSTVFVLAKADQHDTQVEQPTSQIDCLFNDFNSLNGEIALVEGNIKDIEDQLDMLDIDLSVYDDSLALITDSMIVLTQQSAAQLRQARKNRYRLSEANIYFSTPAVAKALRRAGYLNECIQQSVVQIKALKEYYFSVRKERDHIDDIQQNEDLLYAMLDNQNDILWDKRDQAEEIYHQMIAEGLAFDAAMQRREMQTDTLDRRINYLAAAEPQKKANDSKKSNETPSAFEAQKGKLKYPVSGNYNVVRGFGRYNDPDYPKMTLDNPGIDIEAEKGAKALAVYGGVVSAVFRSSGFHHIVMIRHGEYITVYANLKNVSVKKNEKVKAGQNLGTIYTDPSDKDRTILHFEVRKEKKRLNPLEWIK